jgi:hypothetical protein
MNNASTGDYSFTRGDPDGVTANIIPGYWTHSALKDWWNNYWMDSRGEVDGSWVSDDCPLGFFGGVAYGGAAGFDSWTNGDGNRADVGVYHLTWHYQNNPLSTTNRNKAADLGYYWFYLKYPVRTEDGHRWNSNFSSYSYNSCESNYDWGWIDTSTTQHPYCSAVVLWGYRTNGASSSFDYISGWNDNWGPGLYLPRYNHWNDVWANGFWLADHGDTFWGTMCDWFGGQEGWDAVGHFLKNEGGSADYMAEGECEPDEGDVEDRLNWMKNNYGTSWAITPSELNTNHPNGGYVGGYWTY